MSDQHALPPNSTSQQFTEGTPVYDLNGEKVGTVSKQSLTGNMLILHKGVSFDRDIQIPLSTVQRSDSHGIYLSVSKEKLQHEHSTAPQTTTESSEGGLISQGVDVIEQTPDTVTKGVGVIERHPDTVTKGVGVIERHPDTVTKGEDVIEQTPDTVTKDANTIERDTEG